MATKKSDAGVEPGKEVVNWEERMAAEAKQAAAVERPQVANISLRAGVMSYQGQPIPDNNIDCIVVASVFENRWYEHGFDPGNIQAPECFALSASGEDMVPHANSTNVQNTSCHGCEKAKWGSAAGDSRGKACGEIRRLILLPTTELTADAIGKAEAALMKVSVTNVKHWSNYVNELAAAYNRPPWAVITNVSVKPDMKTQFRITFEVRDLVKDPEVLSAIDARRDPLTAIASAPYDSAGNADKPEPKEDTKY